MKNRAEQVRAWRFLLAECQKIQDPLLRHALIADFHGRAFNEWGWNPLLTQPSATNATPELDEWEKDFIADIQITADYCADIRQEKRHEVLNAAKVNILDFIKNGGTPAQIPQSLATPDIVNLYHECLAHLVGDAVLEAEDFINRTDKSKTGPQPLGEILTDFMHQIQIHREAKHD